MANQEEIYLNDNLKEEKSLESKKDNHQIEEDIFSEMMRCGVHYGRAKKYTHPLMKPYLLKTGRNIEFFDLKIVLEKINEAAHYLKETLAQGKRILFVGVTPAAQNKIKEIAEETNQFYLNYKWVAGFLTNFETIQARLIHFRDLLEKEKSGELEKYLPQQRNRLEKELEKLKNIYNGVIEIEKLPDVIFIVNLYFKQHRTAKREALKRKIPIVSFSSSDNDISGVEIVIPGNDKAPKSIAFVIDYLKSKIKS